LVLVCVAVARPPAPPPAPLPAPIQPTNPAAFDPKAIERFARSMAEGGPIIMDLAMKNNVNNPNYRLACFSYFLPFFCSSQCQCQEWIYIAQSHEASLLRCVR